MKLSSIKKHLIIPCKSKKLGFYILSAAVQINTLLNALR